MNLLREIRLADVSVRQSDTFDAAAQALRGASVSTIAVLDDRGKVVGLFGERELLRGAFPRYLAELHHTAFTEDDRAVLAAHARQVSGDMVAKHMAPPVTVDSDASAMHVAERFLHTDVRGLAVVDAGRYAGMLDRGEFCRAVISAVEPSG